jgi:hypothetical protein
MCFLADSLPILRAMVGDTIVAPAPPSITDGELIELVKASVLLRGVTCTTVVQQDGQWAFSPCPPNGDTLAYILQGAAYIRLGAESPVSYRTRALSVSRHPQGLADMRRYAENLLADIEARGNVCNLTPVAAGMISVCLDLITQVYPVIGDACGCLIAGKQIVEQGEPAAPAYAPETVAVRTPVPLAVDSVSVVPPQGKALSTYVPGSASLEWVGAGTPYPLGLSGSYVLDANSQMLIVNLLSQPVALNDYMLVTLWK